MANRLTPPKSLTKGAAAEFARLAEALDTPDPNTLAICAQAWADWQTMRAFIAENGLTYVIRDKDGQLVTVKEFPQVAIARKAEALYLRCWKDLKPARIRARRKRTRQG